MEITARGLWTMVHGMGFGALYLLACSGALVQLSRQGSVSPADPARATGDTFLRAYLVTMVVLAWVTVLTGAYVIYPWYRAAVPTGVIDLAGYPQRLLLSSVTTAGWHTVGMEWKEHVAWLVPISITMAAAVVFEYGERGLGSHPILRRTVLGFVLVSFFAAAIAASFGAMLAKKAPINGGTTLHLMGGK